jgi:hypothetical protein
MSLAKEYTKLDSTPAARFITEKLKSAQRYYTGRVEIVVAREKQGDSAKLEIAEKIGIALLKIINRISNTLDSILDIKYYKVSFTSASALFVSY